MAPRSSSFEAGSSLSRNLHAQLLCRMLDALLRTPLITLDVAGRPARPYWAGQAGPAAAGLKARLGLGLGGNPLSLPPPRLKAAAAARFARCRRAMQLQSQGCLAAAGAQRCRAGSPSPRRWRAQRCRRAFGRRT